MGWPLAGPNRHMHIADLCMIVKQIIGTPSGDRASPLHLSNDLDTTGSTDGLNSTAFKELNGQDQR